MEDWYYVFNGERHGPVDVSKITSLFQSEDLKEEDYVWTKGFDNWKKIKDVDELMSLMPKTAEAPTVPQAPIAIKEEVETNSFTLSDLDENQNNVFIRIGDDRGGKTVDYGPYNSHLLKRLYNENRINGKTLIFILGMDNWVSLSSASDYKTFFGEEPPVISEIDKRSDTRKPFIARLFFANSNNVYEGICRDISIGGMQVLVDNFPGKAEEKISINVHPENSEFQFVADGVIVRMLEGNKGFSFRFDSLKEDAQKAINNYLQSN